MPAPVVLVSGFGPFEAVELNPSGATAQALAERPPPGLDVRAAVLPVSFARAPKVWDEAFSACPDAALLVGLGVAKRPGFRLERWGSPQLKLVPRPDVDGHLAREYSCAGPRLESGLDLPALLAGLRRRGVADARLSRTAGGYVCERIYHHLLTRAAERAVPALFVHLPPLRFTALERQIEVVGWVLEEWLGPSSSARQSASSSGG